MLMGFDSQQFCSGNEITFVAPGSSDLASEGWGDGRAKSYACWLPDETTSNWVVPEADIDREKSRDDSLKAAGWA